MTSSLVGSEMCIRDRDRRAVEARWKAFFMSPTAVTGGRWISGWAVPVSYTHLTLPTICSV
eukprot:9504090-Prorocentrum_lima.AAC.1